jgi:hypothetical protein
MQTKVSPIDTFFSGEKSFKRDLDKSKTLVKSDRDPWLTLLGADTFVKVGEVSCVH